MLASLLSAALYYREGKTFKVLKRTEMMSLLMRRHLQFVGCLPERQKHPNSPMFRLQA